MSVEFAATFPATARRRTVATAVLCAIVLVGAATGWVAYFIWTALSAVGTRSLAGDAVLLLCCMLWVAAMLAIGVMVRRRLRYLRSLGDSIAVTSEAVRVGTYEVRRADLTAVKPGGGVLLLHYSTRGEDWVLPLPKRWLDAQTRERIMELAPAR